MFVFSDSSCSKGLLNVSSGHQSRAETESNSASMSARGAIVCVSVPIPEWLFRGLGIARVVHISIGFLVTVESNESKSLQCTFL